ncbi:469_t:CDS:2, partial [Acaulospora colombiana]
NSEIGKALTAVGIWGSRMIEYIQFFKDFYEALEWCENVLLKEHYRRPSIAAIANQPYTSMNQTTRQTPPKSISSPRNDLIQTADKTTQHDENARLNNKPTSILMETFEDNADKDEKFFSNLASYFHKVNVRPGEVLWKQGDTPDCLYLVERGILRAHWRATEDVHERPVECILPGTLAGELGFFTKRKRGATLYADKECKECVLWQMKTEDYDELLDKDPKVANDFIRLALNFSAERLSAMT